MAYSTDVELLKGGREPLRIVPSLERLEDDPVVVHGEYVTLPFEDVDPDVIWHMKVPP